MECHGDVYEPPRQDDPRQHHHLQHRAITYSIMQLIPCSTGPKRTELVQLVLEHVLKRPGSHWHWFLNPTKKERNTLVIA